MLCKRKTHGSIDRILYIDGGVDVGALLGEALWFFADFKTRLTPPQRGPDGAPVLELLVLRRNEAPLPTAIVAAATRDTRRYEVFIMNDC